MIKRAYTFPCLLLLIISTVELAAQSKPPVPISDWGKWESIGIDQLSPDGRWLAYVVARSDGKNELRVSALAQGKNRVIGRLAQLAEHRFYTAISPRIPNPYQTRTD